MNHMKCTLYAPNGQVVQYPRRDGQLEPAVWDDANVPVFLFTDHPNRDNEFPYPNRSALDRFELDIDGTRYPVPLMYGRAVGSDILYLLLTLGCPLPSGPREE